VVQQKQWLLVRRQFDRRQSGGRHRRGCGAIDAVAGDCRLLYRHDGDSRRLDPARHGGRAAIHAALGVLGVVGGNLPSAGNCAAAARHGRRVKERIMILEILLFLWLLTILPLPPMAPFSASNVYFAFVAVLLLGLFIFLPAMR
jgi:hypothetical protein